MKRKISAIFAILLIMSLALSMSAFATLDGQGGISPKVDHVCSFAHKDCVKSAPVRIGAKGIPHCAYGEIYTKVTYGPWTGVGPIACIHGAVGLFDYENYRNVTTTDKCSGCNYNVTSSYNEGPFRTCGGPMK